MQTNIKFYIAIILLISRLSRSFFDFLKFFRTANLKKNEASGKQWGAWKKGPGVGGQGPGS